MKKLNYTEIGALATKIQSELRQNKVTIRDEVKQKVLDKINKLWEKFEKSSDYKVLVKYKVSPSINMVLTLPLKEGDFIFSHKYGYGNTSWDDYIETKGGKLYFSCPSKNPSYEDIKTELILGQIEADDLDSLINKVKKNLKIQ